MNISANTKISELIKANPASIDAVISINKHFEKLRNPVFRKLLASRVTISDAAKIGGCSADDFFKRLSPLGFTVTPDTIQIKNNIMNIKERPAFMQNINKDKITTLDVRAGLASGTDPFQIIMDTLSAMPHDNFLLIINTFEPVPLINILKRKGFESFTEEVKKGEIHTYLKNTSSEIFDKKDCIPPSHHVVNELSIMQNTYAEKTKTIDVRHLEMPQPMAVILQELNILPKGWALLVQHKKIPQFLLPELQENNFSWLISEDADDDVKLLIFR